MGICRATNGPRTAARALPGTPIPKTRIGRWRPIQSPARGWSLHSPHSLHFRFVHAVRASAIVSPFTPLIVSPYPRRPTVFPLVFEITIFFFTENSCRKAPTGPADWRCDNGAGSECVNDLQTQGIREMQGSRPSGHLIPDFSAMDACAGWGTGNAPWACTPG